jgi:hypothetical protein
VIENVRACEEASVKPICGATINAPKELKYIMIMDEEFAGSHHCSLSSQN